jgi:hypothetical protein
LARFLCLAFAQVVQPKSEQPDALGQRVERREQRLARGLELVTPIRVPKLFERVMISKSANLTFRVTVRPETLARSIRSQA